MYELCSAWAGNNYNIAIAGSGLGELTAENFTVPQGSTIVISTQSDTLIQAVIQNAQAGDFKVTVDEVDIFVAALVAVVSAVTVTGFKLTQEGAIQSLETEVTADTDTGAFDIYLTGENLDDLTVANFAGSGLSNLTYDDENAQLSGRKDAAGETNLVITFDNTTIATIGIVRPSQSGGSPQGGDAPGEGD
jgi:hypothetical protein